MLDLIKYAAEPANYIIRDSLMNFEIGAIAEYLDQEVVIDRIDTKMIRIVFKDGHCETINYTKLHILYLPFITPPNISKSWSSKDANFLRQNIDLPNSNLARLLGRTESAIANQKTLIKHSQKF